VADFVRVADVTELEPHGQFTKWVGEHDLLVYRWEGGVKAISNVCRHFGGPVGFHKMKEGVFTCLWHNYRFAAKDGACLSHSNLPLREYQVKVEGDGIFVKLVEA
jgi:methionine sulfoxide reductase heme-binding subunit